jgi:SAM-dependent methyltransferase
MDKNLDSQAVFWENAGQKGYGNAIFASRKVENHVISRHWNAVFNMASVLGLNSNAKVLELGCGDGNFADRILAPNFKHVDAYDYSISGIKRAKADCSHNNITYHAEDITTFPLDGIGPFDCTFMVAFLHHVKEATSRIISQIAKISPRVVILEPDGGNFIRKTLERLPSYRQQGEDSFRLKELINMFRKYGYIPVEIYKINFFPQFTPEFLFETLKRLENIIETHPSLNWLCSTYVIGFASDLAFDQN